MRARQCVAFRERAVNPCLDQWSTISPDADPFSDDEDKRERDRRVLEYAKQAEKQKPIEYQGVE